MNSEEYEHINDLWEDMDRLNAMYEELMWQNDDVLEFVPDYENDRIIIKNKSREMGVKKREKLREIFQNPYDSDIFRRGV